MSQITLTAGPVRELEKRRRSMAREEARAVVDNRRGSYRVATEPVTVRLSFPVALNHYYRTAFIPARGGHGRGHAATYISPDGQAYRAEVIEAWSKVRLTFEGRLAVRIDAVFPDAHERDLDGLLKSLLDSLEHAGAYRNDSQIALLIIEQSRMEKPGWVDVTLGRKPDCDIQGSLFGTKW